MFKDKKVYKLLNKIVGDLGYKRHIVMRMDGLDNPFNGDERVSDDTIPGYLEGKSHLEQLREDFDLLLKHLNLEIRDEPEKRVVRNIKKLRRL